MDGHGEDAYVTLLTNNTYLPGVMVLAHSLRDGGTRKKLACMVAMDVLSADTVNELRTTFDYVIPVERITNSSPANLYLMDRPDLSSAFTKINLWKQTQYRKIVYVDADVVALRAPDELFDLPAPFSAAPDVGWPDCFNSGVMALTPNMGDYYALKALAERGVSFDGADQGLLNTHFRNYNRISFAYNCTPSGNYQYVPAYRHFQSTISMVHFIGRDKPWTLGRHHGGATGVYGELLGRWWAEYDRHYHTATSAAISGQASSEAHFVQQYVAGEQQQQLEYGYSSTPALPTPTINIQHASPNAETTGGHEHQAPPPPEEPMNESSRDANYGGEPQSFNAPPVVEGRRFSAPHAEWNPAMQAPPPNAKPEAANFPSETYSMSSDRDLWQPPRSYPEPPKDMWYEVPKSRAVEVEAKPIFPWESTQTPATRVFVEDRAPSPPPPAPPPPSSQTFPSSELAHSPPPALEDEFSVSPPKASPPEQAWQLPSVAAFVPTKVPFTEYRGANAWDDDDSIGRYVSALQMRRRKGGTQILLSQNFADLGVGGESERNNLKITQFPTENERPSLPVTPAPIRRTMLWGSDRDTSSNLPEAEGVPGQVEWNPEQQLEQLRRNSLLFSNSSPNASALVPKREHPDSSKEVTTLASGESANDAKSATTAGDVSEAATAPVQSSVTSGTTVKTAPSFSTPEYSSLASTTTARPVGKTVAAAQDDLHPADPLAP